MYKKLLVYLFVAFTISTPVRAGSITQSLADYARENPVLVADVVGLVLAAGFSLFLFHKGRVAPVFKEPIWEETPNYGDITRASVPVITRIVSPQTPGRALTSSISPELRTILESIVRGAGELRGLNSDPHRSGP